MSAAVRSQYELFEGACEAVLVLDDNDHVIYANPMACQIFVLSEKRLKRKGKVSLDRVMPDKNQRKKLKVKKSNLQRMTEMTITKADGSSETFMTCVQREESKERFHRIIYLNPVGVEIRMVKKYKAEAEQKQIAYERLQEYKKHLEIFALLFLYIVSGFSLLATKYAVDSLPPLLMTGIRFLLAGTVIFIFQSFSGKISIKTHELKNVLLASLFFRAVAYGCLAMALQSVSSGVAGVLLGIYPVVVAVGQMRSNRIFDLKMSTGLLLGIGSLAVLLLSGGASSEFKWEYLLVLGAALSYAVGTQMVAKKVQPHHVCYEMLSGGLMVLLISPFFESWSQFSWNEVSELSIVSFLFLLVFATVMADSMFAWMLREGSATMASSFMYVKPVFAVLVGCLVGKEAFTTEIGFATLMLLGSLVLIFKGGASLKKEEMPVTTSEVKKPLKRSA